MNKFPNIASKAGIITDEHIEDQEKLSRVLKSIDPDLMGFVEAEGCPNEYLGTENVSSVSSNKQNITIIDNLTTVNFSTINNPKKYLVIHFTAGTVDNGTAAQANTKYFKSSYRGASAHYFVDRSKNVYRCVKDNYVSWHCGTTGSYYHSYCRNSNSIGIEMCSYYENGEYKFYNETIENALELCRILVNKYNIPKENVLMHWHVTHKVCAMPFMTNNKPNDKWYQFVDNIYKTKIEVEKINMIGKVYNIELTSTLNYRSGPDISYECIGRFSKNTILNITGKYNDWYEIDNMGFVHSDYVITYNEIDKMRDYLLSKNIITDKEFWSKYTDALMKHEVATVLAKIVDAKSKESPLDILYKHKIITSDEWKSDAFISKALFLALLDNLTGGTLERYNSRSDVDHWGRNCLDSLCDKEIIRRPGDWIDFEAQVQKDLFIELLYNYKNK